MSSSERKILIALLATSAVGTVAFLWGTKIPLGVPGEWIWKRIRIPSDGYLTFLLSGAIAAIFGGLYLAVAWFGVRRIDIAQRGERERKPRRSCSASSSTL